MAAILSKQEIRKLIKQKPPLVEGYPNLDEQLQPNGFDLTLREVALVQSQGRITVKDSQRQVSSLAPLIFDGLGFIDLVAGNYIITYNEIINLPKNIMALGRPRSSLLRCGASIGTAAWDAGYRGRSQSLMVVHNPLGLRLEKNAGVLQLIFFKLSKETEGYKGTYQGENIG